MGIAAATLADPWSQLDVETYQHQCLSGTQSRCYEALDLFV
jgi:hypothetical protein